MKRLLLLLVLLLLAAAHLYYWYLPRERAVTPPPPAADGAPLQGLAAGAYDVCLWIPYPHQNLGVLAGSVADLPEVIAAAARLSRGNAAAEPRNRGERAREPQELPAFGPFEIPPADEIVACTDLAGGRLRVVARIYPIVSLVAKAAGHLAGNPWLAGGEAGRMRIRWEGRLWSVAAGADLPPARPAAAYLGGVPPAPAPLDGAPATWPPPDLGQPPGLPPSLAIVRWAGARAEIPAGWYALTRNGSDLVLSLVRHDDRGAPGAKDSAAAPAMPSMLSTPATSSTSSTVGAGEPAVQGTVLLAVVGADWHGALPFGRTAPSRQAPGAPRENAGFDPTRPMWTDNQTAAPPSAAGPAGSSSTAGAPGSDGSNDFAGSTGPAGSASPGGSTRPAGSTGFVGAMGPVRSTGPAGSGAPSGPAGSIGATDLAAPTGPLPPAALALFASGNSRLSSLGDLPGLAVFNAAAAGRERWGLPAGGLFRLANGRLPAADLAGWHILALDTASLRQAEALAPRLAALVPPEGSAAPGAASRLSLGLWLDPRATLGIVSRIRVFVEGFPLASRPEVQLWRDWESVLDPLGRCDRAVLTATATPPTLRLLLQGCTTVIPHHEEP